MRSKSYTIYQDQKRFFPFHKNILETGVWRGLSTNQFSKAAHAVYCVCRAYGFQDVDMYNEIEGTEYADSDLSEFWTEVYPDRIFDFLGADLGVIAQKAGIAFTTARKAMAALEEEYLLIENDIHGGYMIMLRPTKKYKAEYLNEQLKETQPAPTGFWKEVHTV
jgi:hypothetical protein